MKGAECLKLCRTLPLVIGERFRFYQRCQRTDESIADFIADLRRLSISCDFGEFLEQACETVLFVG